jgi:transposase
MEYGAIDLHTKESEIRIVTGDGDVVLHRRMATRREAFSAVCGGRPRARVLLETGTESEWVAQHLESLGHEVVVADPNYALMYGQRPRRIKTDRRDVIALAEANRLGIYRPAHRVSSAQRTVRRQLQVRDQLVRMRTQVINLMRGQLRSEGLRIRSGRAESFVARYQALAVPPSLRAVLEPLVQALTAVAPLIAAADGWAQETARTEPVPRRLMTAPGVGPITALSFHSTLDTVTRFRGPGAVTAYLGVVPQEDTSGDRPRRGIDYEGRAAPYSRRAGAGELGGVAIAPGQCDAPRVGPSSRGSPRQTDRDRGLGATPGADSVCHVAGWPGLSAGACESRRHGRLTRGSPDETRNHQRGWAARLLFLAARESRHGDSRPTPTDHTMRRRLDRHTERE